MIDAEELTKDGLSPERMAEAIYAAMRVLEDIGGEEASYLATSLEAIIEEIEDYDAISC